MGYAAAILGLASLWVLAWGLREVLILTFGAVVVATVIRAAALPLVERYPKREKLVVLGVILALLVALGGLSWLFGHQVAQQARDLSNRLPEAVDQAKATLRQNAAGRFVLEKMDRVRAGGDAEGGPKTSAGAAADGDPGATEKSAAGTSEAAGKVGKAAVVTLDKLGHALLLLVTGIYLAVTPRLYLDGAVRLFPVAQRAKVRDALLAAGDTLRKWLLGQMVSMTTIGVLTTLGLWLAGCPVPLALGILAGVLVFVPVIGFIVAFVPMLLMALSESPQVALASVIVFLVVQQLEEQCVGPLAQRWATSLPPALGLLALAAAGTLFGLPGLVFGCPLTVVIMCLVQRLYIENALEGRKAG